MVRIWLLLLLFFKAAAKEPYTLSVCAIFKNEAPYFQEWIEYHKLVGVDHFYLYNNGSTDHYLDVLKPYIDVGDVTLINWPNQKREEWKNQMYAWVFTTQITSYEDAFKQAKGKSKWIAAIDIDEFIVPVKANTIPEVLKKWESVFPGVEVFWRVYGTSGYDSLPEDKLMIEVLNKCTFPNRQLNTVYKTILQTDLYDSFYFPPHGCNYTNKLPPYKADPKELVINHYHNRSKDYFFSTKVKSKEDMDNIKLTPDQIAEMLERGNDMLDPDRHIHRFIPALRDRIQNSNLALGAKSTPAKKKIVNIISDFRIEDMSLSNAIYERENITLRVKPEMKNIRELPLLLQESEKIVVFNQKIHRSILSKIPKEKLVFLLWEPWEMPKDYYENFSRVYTWNEELVDNVKFFKINYPSLMPMEEKLPSFEAKKFCVMVCGTDVEPENRKNDLYSERLRMVEFFETKPKGKLEIYGRLWAKRKYRDYMGPIPGWHSGPEKISVLKNYRFSICFENTRNIRGYVTEKIFCCFAAGCVPVYWGANDVEKYIPRNCFIDYRDFSTREELYTFLERMTQKEYEEYLANIRAFLNSEQAQIFSPVSFQKIFYKAISE